MSPELPSCATLDECLQHDGERVVVVGTYTVWDPLPFRPRDLPPPQQVRVVLGAGPDGPFLGAWGHDGHERPLDEIARLRDRPVRVTGTFRRSMPPHPTDPPYAASVDGPCIHPVEQIDDA